MQALSPGGQGICLNFLDSVFLWIPPVALSILKLKLQLCNFFSMKAFTSVAFESGYDEIELVEPKEAVPSPGCIAGQLSVML